jgi:hypothetical protein
MQDEEAQPVRGTGENRTQDAQMARTECDQGAVWEVALAWENKG